MSSFVSDVMNGNLGGSSPTPPSQVALDPGSQQIVNQQIATAGQDPSYYSGILNQNQGQARSLAQGDQQLQQQSQQLGMQPGQMQAIRNAYNSQANTGINDLVQQNELKGKMMKADYMNKLSSTLLGQQKQAVSQYQVLTQAYQQQEMARAQTISSLFQTGALAGGMMAGSQSANAGGVIQPGAGTNVGGYSPSAMADTYSSNDTALS